jgi:hypothetical protein
MNPLTPNQQAFLDNVRAFAEEVYARNFKYFSGGLQDGAQMTVCEGKEVTTHATKCDVCRCKQAAGTPKFQWRSNGYQGGFEVFWFHPCPACLEAITPVSIEVEMVVTG